MLKRTLEAVGLRTRTDIPAEEIFSASFDYKSYGLGDRDLTLVHMLRDFVAEYNRELPMKREDPVQNASKAAELMYPVLRGLDHEEVWALFLNSSNIPLHREMICTGGLSACVIDSRRIVRTALEKGATGVILYHNHPSGNARPSMNDIKETEKLGECLKVFEMSLLDHIVMTDTGFFSFSEEKEQRFKK